ncbi:hypothetical protein NEHOM01_1552 [Nematocida homosporus]|uniref:uncharacterized protein n=1 Tax=Nematocida homosporus TaxID=1912981 RepID=UPI0022200155|nr:uncharacterized protein NEHOM01_1552 [Nematocida homosporus]KAI5186566.1 hypothetical protein NEHOM01_1552 [Nematocida homosporus]
MDLEQNTTAFPHIIEALSKELPETLHKTTEIEIRLGSILDKPTGQRLSIVITHPCLIRRADTLRFQASIEEKDHQILNQYLQEHLPKPETKKILDTLMRGFRRSETVEINGQKIKSKSILIQKRKMKNIDIFCPNTRYDLRIGISEEIIKEDTNTSPTVYATREKHRTVYTTPSYVLDLTTVLASSANSNQPTEKTFEAELEANNSTYTKQGFIQIIINFMHTLQQIFPTHPNHPNNPNQS